MKCGEICARSARSSSSASRSPCASSSESSSIADTSAEARRLATLFEISQALSGRGELKPSLQRVLEKLERDQVLALIDAEIQKLPARQREAFLMRYWEDMDVAETAAAMGCSEGSVKTHCSRATHTLAQALKAKGITL